MDGGTSKPLLHHALCLTNVVVELRIIVSRPKVASPPLANVPLHLHLLYWFHLRMVVAAKRVARLVRTAFLETAAPSTYLEVLGILLETDCAVDMGIVAVPERTATQVARHASAHAKMVVVRAPQWDHRLRHQDPLQRRLRLLQTLSLPNGSRLMLVAELASVDKPAKVVNGEIAVANTSTAEARMHTVDLRAARRVTVIARMNRLQVQVLRPQYRCLRHL
jgi:hypothetical protein